jgi:hypothetical protein
VRQQSSAKPTNWSYRPTVRHEDADEYESEASSSEPTFETWIGLADDSERPE